MEIPVHIAEKLWKDIPEVTKNLANATHMEAFVEWQDGKMTLSPMRYVNHLTGASWTFGEKRLQDQPMSHKIIVNVVRGE